MSNTTQNYNVRNDPILFSPRMIYPQNTKALIFNQVPSAPSIGTLYKKGMLWVDDTVPTTLKFTNSVGTTTSFVGDLNNTAYGSGALTSVTTGVDNSAYGVNALTALTTGNRNTLVGDLAGDAITTGSDNTGIGSNTLGAITTVSQLTAIGSNALASNTSGTNNAALGYNTLTANTTGGNNTGLGFTALGSVTTGSSNIAIGYLAGGTLTTGSNNIYLGASAVTATEASTMRLGILGTQTTTYISGSPITGETAPAAADASIVAANLATGIKLINAASTFDATGTNIDTQFPGIATGNVIKLLVVNTNAGASAITTAAAGITLATTISLAQNSSRILYIRRTGAAAYTVY
jgi:hypothetical protein